MSQQLILLPIISINVDEVHPLLNDYVFLHKQDQLYYILFSPSWAILTFQLCWLTPSFPRKPATDSQQLWHGSGFIYTGALRICLHSYVIAVSFIGENSTTALVMNHTRNWWYKCTNINISLSSLNSMVPGLGKCCQKGNKYCICR